MMAICSFSRGFTVVEIWQVSPGSFEPIKQKQSDHQAESNGLHLRKGTEAAAAQRRRQPTN